MIHSLLALSAKNKSAKRKASCVVSAGEMVVVGTRKKSQFAFVGSLVDALHEPDQVIEAELMGVWELLVVGKGRTPVPNVLVDEYELLTLDDVTGKDNEPYLVESDLEDVPIGLVLLGLLEVENIPVVLVLVVLVEFPALVSVAKDMDITGEVELEIGTFV